MNSSPARFFRWIVDGIIFVITALVTGVHPGDGRRVGFSPQGKIYYANHNSHGDFLLVWVSLPRRWRAVVRPVAAADYWLGNRVKRFIILRLFHGVAIDRRRSNPKQALSMMREALAAGSSLIIFPEGTRNSDEGQQLQPFKAGIYALAKADPQLELIPVWINNMNRVLPKGCWLPVPLLCNVTIGSPLHFRAGEAKDDFLHRCRSELLALASGEG